jgi:hypothetical protein
VKATFEALTQGSPRRDSPPTLTIALTRTLPQASSKALSTFLEETSEGVLGVKQATEDARGAAKRSAAQAAAAASALAEKVLESENDAAMASTAEDQMEAIDQKAAQSIVDEKAAVAKAEELAISNAKAEERGDFSKNSPAADALLAAKEARLASITLKEMAADAAARARAMRHAAQLSAERTAVAAETSAAKAAQATADATAASVQSFREALLRAMAVDRSRLEQVIEEWLLRELRATGALGMRRYAVEHRLRLIASLLGVAVGPRLIAS